MEDLVAGRYRRLHPLGSGGGGSVWLAQDTLLGRQVAVKTLLPMPGEDGEELARGMREARAAAALQHPGAVAVYDVLEDDRAIVMEYVEGRSLDRVIAQDGPLTPGEAARALLPVAGALAEAHEGGIVHRDIKPANILVTASGEGRLADFGIARGATDVGLTRTGFTAGTAGYFSPELADGAGPTPESDVWALGVTLYQCVEGRLPHPAQPNVLAHLRTIATTEPAAPVRAGALTPLLAEMLAWEPAARPSMAQVVEQLADVAEGRAIVSAERTELIPMKRARARTGATAARARQRGVVVVAGLLLLGLAASGGLVAALVGGDEAPASGATPPPAVTTQVVTQTVVSEAVLPGAATTTPSGSAPSSTSTSSSSVSSSAAASAPSAAPSATSSRRSATVPPAAPRPRVTTPAVTVPAPTTPRPTVKATRTTTVTTTTTQGNGKAKGKKKKH